MVGLYYESTIYSILSIEQTPIESVPAEQLNLKQDDRLSTVGSEASSLDHEEQVSIS